MTPENMRRLMDKLSMNITQAIVVFGESRTAINSYLDGSRQVPYNIAVTLCCMAEFPDRAMELISKIEQLKKVTNAIKEYSFNGMIDMCRLSIADASMLLGCSHQDIMRWKRADKAPAPAINLLRLYSRGVIKIEDVTGVPRQRPHIDIADEIHPNKDYNRDGGILEEDTEEDWSEGPDPMADPDGARRYEEAKSKHKPEEEPDIEF